MTHSINCRKNFFVRMLMATALLCPVMPESFSGKSGQAPIQLPAGKRTIEIPMSFEFDVSDNRNNSSQISTKFTFPRISYAVSDRVMFYSLPWPIVQVKLIGESQSGNSKEVDKGFQLGVRAGAIGSFFNQQLTLENIDVGLKEVKEEIRILPQLATVAKLVFNSRFSLGGEAGMGSVGDDAVTAYWQAEAGWRPHHRVLLSAGYAGGVFHFNNTVPISRKSFLYLYGPAIEFYNSAYKSDRDTYVSHRMPVSLALSVSSRASLALGTSFGRHTPDYLPVSIRWAYAW